MIETNFQTALKCTRDEDYAQAIALYEKILLETPEHIPSHYNLALLQIKLDAIAPAQTHLEHVIALAPDFSPGYFQLAQLLLLEQKSLAAISLLNQAITLDPEYIDAQHLLACALMQQQQDETAETHFQIVLRLNPHHPPAHMNLGLLKLRLGDNAQAKTYLLQALKLDPTLVEAHYNYGVIAMQAGDEALAIEEMQETLARAPDHFAANYNLGLLYKTQQHFQLAIHFLTQAQRLKPDDEHTAYVLSALKQGVSPKNAPRTFVSELFNHYATYYDAHMQDTLQYQVPEQLRTLFNEAIKNPRHDLAILDLGCGTGLCGEYFKDLGMITGVDLSEKMLTEAYNRHNYQHLQEGELVEYLQQSTKESADLIIAADVLGYLGDLNAFFAAAHHTLRAQGLLLFSIECGEADYQLNTHARFAHSEKYIQNLAQHHAFIIHTQQTQTLRYQNNSPVTGCLFLLSLDKAVL